LRIIYAPEGRLVTKNAVVAGKTTTPQDVRSAIVIPGAVQSNREEFADATSHGSLERLA